MWQARFSPLSLGPRLLQSILFSIAGQSSVKLISRCPLADGARPNQPENPEDEPPDSTHGWQRGATLKLETKFFQEQFWPMLSEPEQAQMRSQSGPMSSEPFTSFPTSREARFDSQPFRVSPSPSPPSPPSSQRPSLSVWPSPRPLWPPSFSATAGVLGRRGFALESAAAKMCREAGGRVMTNVRARIGFIPNRQPIGWPSLGSGC